MNSNDDMNSNDAAITAEDATATSLDTTTTPAASLDTAVAEAHGATTQPGAAIPRDTAVKTAGDILLSGMPITRSSNTSPASTESVALNQLTDTTRRILSTSRQQIDAAIESYEATADMEALVLALLPVRNRIWYEAYAPYWLVHCQPVPGVHEYTHYNDLVDLYWAWETQAWVSRDRHEMTVMLPPTQGMIAHEYQMMRNHLEGYLARRISTR